MKNKIIFTVLFLFIAISANIILSTTPSLKANTTLSDLFKISRASAEDTWATPFKMEYYSWGCRCEEVPYDNLCIVSNQCLCSWGACACCW